MRSAFIICFLLLTGGLSGQPGFRGDKNLVSLGFSTGWGTYKKTGTFVVSPVFSFERVLTRKKSISVFATASAGNTEMPEQWGYFDGPEKGDYYSYYGGAYWIKPMNRLYWGMTGVGFEIKRYVMNAGGLAPFGTYYSYGLSSQYYTFKNKLNLRLGEATFDGSEPDFYYYTQTSMLQKIQTINFTFTYGKKRFVSNNLFVDYGVAFGITGLWSNVPDWGTYIYNTDYSQSVDDIHYNSFLVLMNRAHRLQFYMKGGWLF